MSAVTTLYALLLVVTIAIGSPIVLVLVAVLACGDGPYLEDDLGYYDGPAEDRP